MPLTYHVDHQRRLVVAVATGVLTDCDLFNYQREVWSKVEIKGYDELFDMAEVTEVELPNSERLSDLAALSSAMDPPSFLAKLATVATNDLHFGLARMYQGHREACAKSTKKMRVFRSRDEALLWLNSTYYPQGGF